eukprot:55602-Eustigmatos_ZCMA.PRE.1
MHRMHRSIHGYSATTPAVYAHMRVNVSVSVRGAQPCHEQGVCASLLVCVHAYYGVYVCSAAAHTHARTHW